MDFGHVFSVLAPDFPTRNSITFKTVPQGAGAAQAGLHWHSGPWNIFWQHDFQAPPSLHLHPKWVLCASSEFARVAPSRFCPGLDPLLAILQMEMML